MKNYRLKIKKLTMKYPNKRLKIRIKKIKG